MNQEPIKIEILEEDIPATAEERNLKREIGERVAKTAVSTGKKVWQSETRKKVTRSLGKGATAVAAKGSQIVQERVVKAAEERAKAQLEATKERIRQTDWKAEAKKGLSASLRWISQKLSALSEKYKDAGSDPKRNN